MSQQIKTRQLGPGRRAVPVNTILCRKEQSYQGGSPATTSPLLQFFATSTVLLLFGCISNPCLYFFGSEVLQFQFIFLIHFANVLSKLVGISIYQRVGCDIRLYVKAGTHASSIPNATYLSTVSFYCSFPGASAGKNKTSWIVVCQSSTSPNGRYRYRYRMSEAY